MQPSAVEPIPLTIPGFCSTVSAGFPSPAADHAQKRIDLNEHLIRNKEATFLFRVRGDSMTGIGIYEGDKLLVDRSIDLRHNAIVTGGGQRKRPLTQLLNGSFSCAS